ncbi:hypothetical protein [Natranaerofaba carboxydovora]|uniref:hypothetical protein n=1 Tax=Natranaerofaba carboxydovora TaxID=2742683 RepID=UPI001F12AEC4|nr:hypothetical protein [Natranaerofaba carboxydovora]UMZ73696.1 hypothetical protein ACONDI_01261 [Natranaerofaba carboxydovora]
MIKLTNTYINYNSLNIRGNLITKNTKNTNNSQDARSVVKKIQSFQIDQLEISIHSWKARSLTEDIINFVSDLYNNSSNTNNINNTNNTANVQNGSKEQLRSFYAVAKESIDNGFGNYKNNRKLSQENKNILNSAHRQAVKELKDWYHNGGKPREKVNFTSIKISTASYQLEITKRVEECINKELNQETLTI